MSAERSASHLSLAIVAAAAALAAAAPSASASPTFGVVDLHVDLPFQAQFRGKSPLDQGQATTRALLAGHVEGVVLPLFVPERLGVDPEQLTAVHRAALALRARQPFAPLPGEAAPRTQTWLSLEGARTLTGSPRDIAAWVARGVRVVGVIHSSDSALGGSATGNARGGLTPAGAELARAALEAGALLDASHASDAAFDDLLELSRARGVPLLATHSSARALTPHPRNLDDERLRALAATGGVVGVNFHAPYVSRRPGRATLTDVVAHLEHLVAVAGEDAVAIGSDFDGDMRPPVGLASPADFPALARALLAAGWSEARVRKVFSVNARRVLGPPR
ncbi:MAG: membrane dipeptidase [Polyangiaceae bacterium]|nr:membrane dipeptidase [Polyangiaceae bacterium]